MSELEEKLGAVLQNPQLMQQIMGMAQALSTQPSEPPQPKEPPPAQTPQLDPAMVQKLSALAGSGGIDQNQQRLLKALQPYLSRDRITRLERAMGAARMASAASVFLNTGGLNGLLRR